MKNKYIIKIIILIIILIFIIKKFNIDKLMKILSLDFIIKNLYNLITELDFSTKVAFLKNPIDNKNIEFIPELPILTKYNRDKYIEWHLYYENIYKKGVESDVNLNEFTWFYWYKLPLKNIKIYFINSCYLLDLKLNKINNICWSGIFGPEKLCYKYGFFVKRLIKNNLFYKKELEVFRVDLSKSIYKNIYVFKEEGCIWYFHTIGSGFFIKNYENKLIFNDKTDWNFNSYYNEMDIYAIEELKRNNIKMLIIKECHKIHNTIPRTEIVVVK